MRSMLRHRPVESFAQAVGAPDAGFLSSVLSGLSHPQKYIASKYLYDEQGSTLFEQICELPEYYLTRTEIGLLHKHADEIGELIGDNATLVELGSGASAKVRILLDAAPGLINYIPVDISYDHLWQSSSRLAADYPKLTIMPVFADYTKPFDLPDFDGRRTGFFPGSTIGNFKPAEAVSFLAQIGALLGRSASLLIGVDLQKDEAILLPAYNDAQSITAAFNLNLLARINRELEGTFEIDAFAHEVCYCNDAAKVEMHLRSHRKQTVFVKNVAFDFAENETIHTEDSHKYTLGGFQALAEKAGWMPVKAWVDPNQLFSLHFLRVAC